MMALLGLVNHPATSVYPALFCYCRMTADLAEDQFGPAIAFREYSFLQNPQAAELNKSVVTLQVCQVSGENAVPTCSTAMRSAWPTYSSAAANAQWDAPAALQPIFLPMRCVFNWVVRSTAVDRCWSLHEHAAGCGAGWVRGRWRCERRQAEASAERSAAQGAPDAGTGGAGQGALVQFWGRL